MNRQGEKGIEWCDISWNPITGCLHGCWYCYARKLFTRFHKNFEPTFYPERLEELKNLKKPSKIFVCSVADLFADWTPKEWTSAIFNKINEYPQHEYQLLTKQPQNLKNFMDYDFKNCWLGVTINENKDLWKIPFIKIKSAKIRFLSFEPLLENLNLTNRDFKGIDWIIIGKLTGSKRIKLQKEWVENIIKIARKNKIPIFIKNNINWEKKIQQFPKLKGIKIK